MDKLLEQLRALRSTLRKDEVWRDVNFDAMLPDSLRPPQPSDSGTPVFHCQVPNLDTYRILIDNGFCHQPLQTLPNGVVMGGLRDAQKEFPQLVEKYQNRCADKNAYATLNSQNYTDGAFVFVPEGVTLDKPIQLLSLHSATSPLLLQVRNVICVGAESKITIIHCDDSAHQQPCFANNVTELAIDHHAQVELYKMQNLNDNTGLLNHTYATMQHDANIRTVAITLNGGHIRNHTVIRMQGEHCHTEAHGLYLNDSQQQVDNYIYVDHQQPNCISHELYKGILDDSAHATFNGHVLVNDGATKTEAYQSNRNILLTDKATVYTKPFLEIYNDDVKCSHGSTIGQLDERALFYLRSRGISERSARTLLLYAFCHEVVQQIVLEPLQHRISDMIKQRLHGELTVCADCVLGCDARCGCSDYHFDIDTSKL